MYTEKMALSETARHSLSSIFYNIILLRKTQNSKYEQVII